MSDNNKEKKLKRERRHKRNRAKIAGTPERPRLSVFRSNDTVYLQLIDDEKSKTLASVNKKEIIPQKKTAKTKAKSKTDISFEAGKLIAEKAKKLKIESVVFDKGGYRYHGRVKAVAEGAREGGLQF